jgi:hypothetical protein
VLPPCTETPGMAGEPLAPRPAPPGPGYGEIPARADGSDPRPVPSFAAPELSPDSPLPGPLPLPIPDPPPEPPMPIFAVPDGDMASAPPLPPEFGSPTFVPGWLETTTPDCPLGPDAGALGAPDEPVALPLLLGGAAAVPRSSIDPVPLPLVPRPLPVGNCPPPRPGGGGTRSADPIKVPA